MPTDTGMRHRASAEGPPQVINGGDNMKKRFFSILLVLCLVLGLLPTGALATDTPPR